MADGTLQVLDGTHLRGVDLSLGYDGPFTGANILDIAHSRASSSLFGLSLPDYLKASALTRLLTPDADAFLSAEYAADKASEILRHYISAIADELKDNPLVVSVLDGSTLRLLLEDEHDFAMLAESLFTDLDVEDKGKISKSEIRNALVQMGVEMGVPPFSEFPQLNDLLKKHGADGEEKLGQAQFAQLLQSVLQDLEEELSKKNVVSIQKLRQSLVLRLHIHKSKMKNFYMPPELIEQILLRLPVVSLIRFKCVCKAWFSLISDPQFAISHFNLISPPSSRLLLKLTEVSVCSVDMDFGVVHLTLPPPAVIQDESSSASSNAPWILGSCRGLVCLNYQEKSNDLIIWNPSTGVYNRFPLDASHDLCKSDKGSGSFGQLQLFLYGFGYDSAEDDYLLVIIHLTDDVEFFSFKTNTWNTVDGVEVEYMIDDLDFQSGTLLNGAVHWLVSCERVHDDLEELVFVIIAFDMTQRTFSEIQLFNDFSKNRHEIYGLRELRGCLTLCCLDLSTDMIEIWMMRDEFLATWSRAMVISNLIRFCPISVTTDDRIFGSHVSLSLTLEKREHNGVLVMRCPFLYDYICPNLQSAMYTQSLLPPPSVIGGGR